MTRESVNRIAFVILKRYCVPGSGLASVAQEAEPGGLRQEARRRETLQAASPKDKSDGTRPLVVCHFAQEAYFPLLTSPRPSRLTDSAGESLDGLKNLHCRALALKSLRDFVFSYLYIYIYPHIYRQMLFQVVRPRCDVLSKAARRAQRRLLLLL